MPTLITLRDLTIRFQGPPLLDSVSCQIESGQHIGLLGRNGAGKTTLMKLIQGQLQPDEGSLLRDPRLKLAMLQQEVPHDLHGSIREIVATGLPLPAPGDEDEHDWKRENMIDQIITRMELDDSLEFSRLSSGMKRRVLLARALVQSPDLLLLDEPTNHLDIDAIEWLEKFLSRFSGALLFVTHDRAFLRRIATRILEIDRGRIFDWSCDYDTFLVRKEQALEAEEKEQALFDKKLALEEVWIRTGIKARRTRNEGRVRALEKMRLLRSQRREKLGTSNLQIQQAERSGNSVIEAKKVSFEYQGRPIVKQFSTNIMRGDKVGIIGPNGVGKTTLLKILLGQLAPREGTVRVGTQVQIAYFDQLRAQLDEEQTVAHNVGEGYEMIEFNGNRRHVLGYLQDFLFTPERARTQVRFLSGGERNRILLAKLFAKPANMIVMDEPTNDLDAETLEMLESRLVEYEGTVLLVSHDRAFLNNVVSSTIVFENGNVKEYDGGYDDWIRQSQANLTTETSKESAKETTKSPGSASKPLSSEPKRKLKFKEQQELSQLPSRIEMIEAAIAEMHAEMAVPGFYQQAGKLIADKQEELVKREAELSAAYARWEELEGGAS